MTFRNFYIAVTIPICFMVSGCGSIAEVRHSAMCKDRQKSIVYDRDSWKYFVNIVTKKSREAYIKNLKNAPYSVSFSWTVPQYTVRRGKNKFNNLKSMSNWIYSDDELLYKNNKLVAKLINFTVVYYSIEQGYVAEVCPGDNLYLERVEYA